MKFNGYWEKKEGVAFYTPKEIYETKWLEIECYLVASTAKIDHRGATLWSFD